MAEARDQNSSRDPDGKTRDRRSAALAARRERAQTRRSIDKLDERERLFSFAAAGLAAVAGIGVYVAETSNSHFRLAKGQLTPQTTLILGLGAAALLVIATFVGRRALVGFVALFTFLAFSSQFLLGIPFLALAIWLLYRSFKIQREASAAARASREEGSLARAPTARSSGRAPSAGRGARSKSKGVREANKRYTPKRPPPPAPKPSRRERKAAQSKD